MCYNLDIDGNLYVLGVNGVYFLNGTLLFVIEIHLFSKLDINSVHTIELRVSKVA